MKNSFIKNRIYVPKPIRIEREVGDVIVIEGVRYSGHYFRTVAYPKVNVLYAIRRDDDLVWITEIRNVDEAKKFFGEVGDSTLTPTLSPQGEGEEGEDDVI